MSKSFATIHLSFQGFPRLSENSVSHYYLLIKKFPDRDLVKDEIKE